MDYKIFKKKMVAKMKATSGATSGHMPEQKIEDDIRLVQEAIKSQYHGKDFTKLPIKVYEGMASLWVDGNVAHQDGVAWAAKEKFKDDKRSKEEGTGMIQEARGIGDAWLPNIEPEGRYERPEVLQAIYDHSKPISDQQVRGREFWRLFFVEGNLQEDAAGLINEMFKDKFEPATRQAYINTFFPAFQKEYRCLGEAAEKALREEFYPEGVHHGGRGEPDIVIGNPENPTRIVEIKSRKLESDGHMRQLRDLVKDEVYLKEYIAMKTPIDIVSVYYSKQGCIVTIGHVIYEAENS